MHRLLLVAALLLTAFAGCLDDSGDGPTDDPSTGGSAGAGPLYVGAGTLFAGPALYRDPQNAPHPSFNFPTLAYPADGPNVPDLWKPIPASPTPSQITALDHVTRTDGVDSGAGIALFGRLAVVPGYGAPSYVVDISDPTSPRVLSQFEPQDGMGTHRGAAFIPFPDGRLSVVIATSAGIDHWDLTDPASPKPMPILEPEGGSHKVGVIPGTPIIVNAGSDGGSRADPANSQTVSAMFDLSDPSNPVRLPDFRNGYGCHHVYFWNDVDEQKYRGVCAGIQYTQIWDTTDPYNPTVIVNVPFGNGGVAGGDLASAQFPGSIAHYAGLSLDGKVLLMGDESGGGSLPPGCLARADTPVGGLSPPIGAVWFYDVADEQNPRLLGWISASQLDKMGTEGDPANMVPRSCTAHHGRLVPIEGRDVLAMSFYGSGVVVIDFTSMRGEGGQFPEVVAQYADQSDTWETWYYNGYLFTGDLVRGMDVLTLA